MASANVETTQGLPKAFKVISVATARPNGNESGSHVTSPTQIQKVSLVKLAPLEKTNASKTL
ncbi:Hypothetical predicted protein, partial [Paramuricea clavata]